MANYYTHYSFIVPHPDPAACKARLLANDEFVKRFGVEHSEVDEDDVDIDYSRGILETFLVTDNRGFWLTDDCNWSPQLATLVGQHILEDAASKQVIVFQAAFTCDKPRIDAYGGITIVFNRFSSASQTTGDEDIIEGLKRELE